MKQTIQKLFTTPTPYELATRELIEAERELLASETAVEYAKAMAAYNRERIARLQEYLNTTRK